MPAARPAALRCLRLAVPRLHSFCSLRGGRVRRPGLELVTRWLRPGCAEETTGSPRFLGNPDCPFAHVPHRRRQGRWHQTPTVPRRGPGSSNGKGSCERTFDAQEHGFRTRCLRFAVRVTPRHARLASGRWSGATGRAFHPQGSAERFLICFLHLILPSQAFLAQSMWPTRRTLRQELTSVFRAGACAVAKVCLVLSGKSRPRWKKAGKTSRLPSSERSEGTTACG